MRNRDLHDALKDFAVEAAGLLRESLHSGAELEFDLEAGGGGGPTLYHYRPLTGRFIDDRWARIANLASFARAAEVLGDGASAYLRVSGVEGADSEPALQALLERLWADVTDFRFPEERFERVYAEVERTLFEKSQPATVLVPVHGIEMQVDRVELGEGLSLVRGDLTDAPDQAVWGDGGRDRPAALLVLARDVAPEDPMPLQEARLRFRRALSCLRLWKAGGIALSALAWRRAGDGRWQPFEIEPTGAVRGEPWILIEGEEVELRQFVEAIEGVSRGGSVAWALSRFEMGCGRRLESEALSDYLLALRALVETGGETGRTSLALRVAVLCAEESERKRVAAARGARPGPGAIRDGRRPRGPVSGRSRVGLAPYARGRGRAPSARPPARCDVRLSRPRSARRGGWPAARPARAFRDPGERGSGAFHRRGAGAHLRRQTSDIKG